MAPRASTGRAGQNRPRAASRRETPEPPALFVFPPADALDAVGVEARERASMRTAAGEVIAAVEACRELVYAARAVRAGRLGGAQLLTDARRRVAQLQMAVGELADAVADGRG